MEVVLHKLARLKARKKVLIALLAAVLSLALVITGVGAWMQFTGGVIRWDAIHRPFVDPYSGDPEAKPVAGEAVDPEATTATNPFAAFGEDGKFTNENNYPLLVRISITEYESRAKTFYSENFVEPNAAPCRLGALPGTGWKTLDPANIIWAAPGEKPELFGMYYRATADGFEFVPFCFREEQGPPGFPYGNQEVKCNRITYYSTDGSTVFSATIHDVQYRYYYWSSLTSDNDYTYLQWAEGLAARMKVADSEKYVTSTPTSTELFKYWTPEGRDTTLQLDQYCYRYPGLARTLTKGQWFYNENDGYFYYVGILEKKQSISPLGLECPVTDDGVTFPNFTGIRNASVKEDAFLLYNSVGYFAESIEAHRDAATALWGLTFEPGSLGAMIFGE